MNKIVLLATAALLVGCGVREEQERREPIHAAPPAKENVRVVAQTNHILMYEVSLDDGTRCIVQYQGGVDCDWDQRGGR